MPFAETGGSFACRLPQPVAVSSGEPPNPAGELLPRALRPPRL